MNRLKKMAVVVTAMITMGSVANMPIVQNIITNPTLNASADYYGDFEYSIIKLTDTPYKAINGTCVITKYLGTAETVTIPSTINGIKVCVIGDSAFKGNTKVKKVILPDTIIDLQVSAFHGCTNLETINTPDSLKVIRSNCFENCSKLKSFNFNKVEIIGWYILKSCKSITEAYIPGTLKRVGIGAFEQCTNLKTLTFAEGVEIIESYVALDTPALEKITIAGSVKEISDLALCYATYNYKIDENTSGTTYVLSIDNLKEYNFVEGSAAEQYGIDKGIIEVFEGEFSYENNFAPIPPPTFYNKVGDPNGSGAVDASDASVVLAEYSAIQTGKKETFTEMQKRIADVNRDGVVDAVDASEILRYYAELSTGKNPTWSYTPDIGNKFPNLISELKG